MGFCGSDKVVAVDRPEQFDPLGNNAVTGGPDQRKRIFGQLASQDDQANKAAQNTYRLGTEGSNNAGWGAAQGLANANMAGNYLNGGSQFRQNTNDFQGGVNSAFGDVTGANYLTGNGLSQILNYDRQANALRNSAGAGAADEAANIRSAYGRAGVGFGTGQQQAEMANAAAARARADEGVANLMGQKNQILAQNYGQERERQMQAAQARAAAAGQVFNAQNQLYNTERGYQNQGAQQLALATATPLALAQQGQAGLTSGLASQADIIKGLAGGGQVATPNSTVARQPGAMDYIMGLGSIGATAGM